MIALLALTATAWQPITLSWYSGGSRTADGTRMRNDGRWLATYREPLGTVVEIRANGVTQRLVVRDRTAKRFGHRADLPRDTWKEFGYPLSKGLIKAEYRRIK